MAETNTGMTDEQFKKQLIHGVKSRMVIMTVAVYNKPRDYPDSYVARVYFSAPGRMWPSKDIFIVRDTLEAIRAAIPMQLMHRLERDINDDPHIIETWV